MYPYTVGKDFEKNLGFHLFSNLFQAKTKQDPAQSKLGRDGEHLMSLALLRLSVKFECALPEHVDIALKLLGAADEKPALLSLERRLVMMLGSSDAQPLARHLSTRTSGVLIEHIVNQLGCQG